MRYLLNMQDNYELLCKIKKVNYIWIKLEKNNKIVENTT